MARGGFLPLEHPGGPDEVPRLARKSRSGRGRGEVQEGGGGSSPLLGVALTRANFFVLTEKYRLHIITYHVRYLYRYEIRNTRYV